MNTLTKCERPCLVLTAPDVFENSSLSLDQVKAGELEPLDDIIADVKERFQTCFARAIYR